MEEGAGLLWVLLLLLLDGLGDLRNKIVGAGAGGLEVLCADLEDFFEVGGDAGQAVLQEEDDVLAVLALFGLALLLARERLQARDLLVKAG